MQSAIPEGLRCPRTQATRAPSNHIPAAPACVAQMPAEMTRITMGYFGVQYRSGSTGRPQQFIASVRASFAAPDGPDHQDLVHHVDAAGYDNLIVVAYWANQARYQAWWESPNTSQWWNDPARSSEGAGYFREVLTPRIDRFETLFSNRGEPEGVARLGSGRIEDIQEHGYWGSARDRLPASQTDALAGEGTLGLLKEPRRSGWLRVKPSRNVAVIRSGQDWSQTFDEERAAYLRDIEPTLEAGMRFLRDEGTAIGCFTNRYLRHLDDDLRPLDQTFGLSHWRSLEHLERWAESHPTHLKIYGSFMRMVQAMKSQLKVRLSHEVTVVHEDEQTYEYLNCHNRTGLMNGCQAT